MSLLLAKAAYPILSYTTRVNSPWLNKLTNKLSHFVFCSLLRNDPRVVGVMRAATWITNQINSTNFTAFREDPAARPNDIIRRGDGQNISVEAYPVLQQLSYSPCEAIRACGTKGFFGGKVLEKIYRQVLHLTATPDNMHAFVLADSATGFAFEADQISVPKLTTRIILNDRTHLQANVIVKVLSTGICGTDIRGVHGKRQEINAMTTLGHEVLAVVAETHAVSNPEIVAGRLVNLIPHYWCGTCLPCMTGHTNYCESRKHMGFERTSQGGLSQYMAVPEQNIVVHPAGLTFPGQRRHFAILEPITCCLHSRELLKKLPGDPKEKPYQDKNVVIFGAGSIGCMHASLAKKTEQKK